MRTNAYFAIGSSHLVCQDYARAGRMRLGDSQEERAFGLVSDGCSSSAHTDVGARLLVAAAMQDLSSSGDEWSPRNAIAEAAVGAERMGLELTCLDATLLAAWESADGAIDVRVCGDGVVAAKAVDGSIETWNFDHGGAPEYLSYSLDEERRARYLELGFGTQNMSHSRCGVVQSVQEYRGTFALRLERERYESLLLLSDGVDSFESSAPEGERSPRRDEVLRHLLAFKSSRGEFLVRRCRRFLRRDCARLGWRHTDDVGAAGFYFGDGP